MAFNPPEFVITDAYKKGEWLAIPLAAVPVAGVLRRCPARH